MHERYGSSCRRLAPWRTAALATVALVAWTGRPDGVLPLFIEATDARQMTSVSASVRPPGDAVVRLNPEVLRPGPGGLRAPGSRLAVSVGSELANTLVVDKVEVRDAAAWTSFGRVEGRPGSQVLLAVVEDAMAGTIILPGQAPLQIEHLGGGLHRFNAVTAPSGDWCAPGSLATEEDLPRRAAQPAGPRDPRLDPRALAGADASEAPVIDFLVLYTPRALAGAGGEDGIHALMDYAVAENNLCYANSGIAARWNIAGRELIPYTDSGSITADLLWLMDNATAASLKTAYRADIVMLMTEYDRYGYAGIASSNAAGHGYTVFLRPWVASGLYVVPHEVGHLLGAGHDRLTCTQRYSRAGCGAFYDGFSYGHRFELDGVSYRTVMAYEPGISTPYFSGPNVLFRGHVPTGIAAGNGAAADNVRTINERAPIIASALDARCRFGFATETVEVAETADAVTLVVRRTGELDPATVECVTVADTAASGEDFLALTERLEFPAGTAETNVTIPILRGPEGTLGVEGDEVFMVVLRNPATGTGLERVSRVRVTIRDADTWVRVARTRQSVQESSAVALVEVERGGDLTVTTEVPFVVQSGTASQGADFDTLSGTLRFAPGETLGTIHVPLLPDALPESDERLVVGLSSPDTGGLVAGGRETLVTILDDDREGSLDPTFALTRPLRPPTSLGVLLPLPDGRVLVTGAPAWRDSPALVLRRLLGDGSVDPSFGEVEFLPAPGDDPGAISPVVLNVTLQPDGRILVAGEFATVRGVLRPNLVRLLPDGTLDESFTARPDGPCYQTVVQPDGQIIVGGSFRRISDADQGYVARLHPDGTLDRSFAPRPNGDSIRVRGLALQPDGRLLVCGTFWGFEGLNRPYFTRLNADGRLDRLFAARPDGIVNAVSVLPDNRILMAGGFTAPRLGLARLLPSGSTDPDFDPGTIFNAPVRHVAPLADGRLMAAGGFTAAGPANQHYLIRLQADGRPDTTFDTGTGPDDIVSNVALEADGAVLVAGFFSQLNGLSRAHLARLRGVDLRLRFGQPTLLADGLVRLRLEGYVGADYTVEVSSDLHTWTVTRSGTLTAPNLEWQEPVVSDSGTARYYRAQSAR